MAMFVHALKQAGCLDHLTMTVCNVGSRKIDSNDDYATQSWGVFAPKLCIYGFDADPATCEEANADLLNRDIDWVEKHIPVALNDTAGETTLYVTKHPMCSSLYAPNEELLKRFNGLVELAGLDHTTRIEATTLDLHCDSENLGGIDFLQVDVQGADLDVLKGGARVIEESTLAVQVEVEFEELYCDQPLFTDVDAYMRAQGFKLFELHQTRQVRANSPIHSTIHPGQVVWGEAYYLRDPLNPKTHDRWKTPDNILKLACIADILDFADYSYELLEYLVVTHGRNPRYNVADIIVQQIDTVFRASGDPITEAPLYERLFPFISPAMDRALRAEPATALSNVS